jgi:hypothetical protein
MYKPEVHLLCPLKKMRENQIKLKIKRTGQNAVPRWDSASRDKQRLLIQQQHPWTKSTGSITPYGKQVSSRNALKKKKPFSQQLHSTFTPPCENVAFVSHLNQQSDTDRPLQVGQGIQLGQFGLFLSHYLDLS